MSDKENKAQAEVQDNRVEVYIPRAQANEDPNLFVSVNGVSYLLPRGKRSLVPHHIAEEIKRSEKAQEAWDAMSAAMAEEASK